jgi:hypothetical protein
MGLTRKTEASVVYLEIKHYCLWQALKKEVKGCDVVQVTNPKTKEVITKYGFRFDTVIGRATKLVKYDTEKKYATRYFGFKLHMIDQGEKFVLDLPYNSQALRRFLRVAPNIDWFEPLSITVFKGKKKEGTAGSEETGIWFQQVGETVRPYYTKENPHGMPEATYDDQLQQWDFRAQHRWLVGRLIEQTMPDIEEAAKVTAPPVEPDHGSDPGPDTEEAPPVYDTYEPTDDDVPF